MTSCKLVEKVMLFEYKDILILGDSFCERRDLDSDWPMIVSRRLTGSNDIPRGIGFGGISWWSVRKALIKEIKLHIPKVLIFCHTEPNRLPHDYDIPLNSSSVFREKLDTFHCKDFISLDKLERIKQAARLYYEELWSHDYCQWAQASWFQEIDTLIEAYNIPYVIHMNCFAPSISIPYIFRNGITIKEDLQSISLIGMEFRNHFTEEINQKLGNRLADLILINQTGLVDLDIT
jgi:hypothetical protein